MESASIQTAVQKRSKLAFFYYLITRLFLKEHTYFLLLYFQSHTKITPATKSTRGRTHIRSASPLSLCETSWSATTSTTHNTAQQHAS